MWGIRVLSGPQAGQVFPLHPGTIKIGRGTSCEVKIASQSISKEHAEFHITDDKLIIADLNSRNGTFINGVRVQHGVLSAGDKFSLHDVFFEALNLANVKSLPGTSFHGASQIRDNNEAFQQAVGHASFAQFSQPNQAFPPYQQVPPPNSFPQAPVSNGPLFTANSLPELWKAFESYFENVALPGVFALAQRIPFRYVIACYVGLFIVLVTLLSTIPMTSVTRSSIQAESQRRARTIARNLALINRQYVIDGMDISVSTQMAENEDGVESALILSAKDGRVIAPLSRSGSYADRPYVLRVRKKLRGDEINDHEYVEQIDSTKIVAATPIKKFDSEKQGQSVVAYAVVVYDMGSLAIDQGEAFSLLIENLAIALILGLILYYFMVKTIEQPIISLNSRIDDALREGKDDIYTEFQFPELSQLASNVNSALSRIQQSAQINQQAAVPINRDAEAEALISTTPHPAIAINAIDEKIISANEALMQLIGAGVNLQQKAVSEIHDQALQAQVRELILQMKSNPGQIARDQLPFPDGTYQSRGVCVSGASEPAFYIVSFVKTEGGD